VHRQSDSRNKTRFSTVVLLFRLDDAVDDVLNEAPGTKLLNLSNTFEQSSTHFEFTCLGVASFPSAQGDSTEATDLADCEDQSGIFIFI